MVLDDIKIIGLTPNSTPHNLVKEIIEYLHPQAIFLENPSTPDNSRTSTSDPVMDEETALVNPVSQQGLVRVCEEYVGANPYSRKMELFNVPNFTLKESDLSFLSDLIKSSSIIPSPSIEQDFSIFPLENILLNQINSIRIGFNEGANYFKFYEDLSRFFKYWERKKIKAKSGISDKLLDAYFNYWNQLMSIFSEDTESRMSGQIRQMYKERGGVVAFVNPLRVISLATKLGYDKENASPVHLYLAETSTYTLRLEISRKYQERKNDGIFMNYLTRKNLANMSQEEILEASKDIGGFANKILNEHISLVLNP